jgi:hypothetical protein
MRAAAVFFLCCAAAFASADTDWQALVAMDAGPKAKPKTVEEARAAGRAHIAAQLALAKGFLEKHPADPRVAEARIRVASLEAALGMADGRPTAVEGAMRSLLAIERDKSVPAAQRAEAGFRRVSLLMQSFRGRELEKRSDIVAAARNFAARHPGDRRVPRVLVEVATICDNDPELKRALLGEAQALARGEALRRRIADDLLRMDLLGKPFSVQFPTVQGGKFDSKSWRGKIGFLAFWSAESAPSVLWLQEFRSALRKLPTDRIGVATVALDKDTGLVEGVLAEAGIGGWPTAVETQGWESPLARKNGVNALPAVFVIDQAGVLRSVNARNSYESWVRALIAGRQPAP